ncbi:MAG: hypothetical protein AAFN78_00925 [Pseudomonadota bacterium]
MKDNTLSDKNRGKGWPECNACGAKVGPVKFDKNGGICDPCAGIEPATKAKGKTKASIGKGRVAQLANRLAQSKPELVPDPDSEAIVAYLARRAADLHSRANALEAEVAALKRGQ